jgi:hypothetical protein
MSSFSENRYMSAIFEQSIEIHIIYVITEVDNSRLRKQTLEVKTCRLAVFKYPWMYHLNRRKRSSSAMNRDESMVSE